MDKQTIQQTTPQTTFRVKSGNFGHQVNSDIHAFANSGNPDETAPYAVSSGFSLFA